MSKLRTVLLLAAGVSLAGCNQYWERKDTLSFGAGDSVAANSALMIPDPWPRGSRDTRIVTDGARAQLAVDRYRRGAVIAPVTNLGADPEWQRLLRSNEKALGRRGGRRRPSPGSARLSELSAPSGSV